MNRCWALAAPLVAAVALASTARAEPPTAVQVEISFLLGYVEGSRCQFYRNGSWYDAQTAQAHLRGKYKHLVAGNLIGSTEDFIDKAATASSFSGRPYAVRCDGSEALSSSQWLRSELGRLRALR